MSKDRNVTNLICASLEKMIYRGELELGDQAPSLHVLAERFHVSTATARHAMEKLKRQGLVHSVRGKGAYVGEGLSRLYPNVVFLLVVPKEPGPPSHSETELLCGAEKEARLGKFTVLFSRIEYNSPAAAVRERFSAIDLSKSLGVIVVGSVWDELRQHLRRGRLPVVVTADHVDHPLRPKEQMDSVTDDIYANCLIAMGELLRRGHTRIGIVTDNDTHAWARLYRKAWFNSLRETGGSVSKADSHCLESESLDEVAAQIATALDAPVRPSAWFVQFQHTGMDLARELLRLGVGIPGDLSLATSAVLDSRHLEIAPGLRLSGTLCRSEMIGRLAVQRLTDKRADKRAANHCLCHTLVAGTWLEGDSIRSLA